MSEWHYNNRFCFSLRNKQTVTIFLFPFSPVPVANEKNKKKMDGISRWRIICHSLPDPPFFPPLNLTWSCLLFELRERKKKKKLFLSYVTKFLGLYNSWLLSWTHLSPSPPPPSLSLSHSFRILRKSPTKTLKLFFYRRRDDERNPTENYTMMMMITSWFLSITRRNWTLRGERDGERERGGKKEREKKREKQREWERVKRKIIFPCVVANYFKSHDKIIVSK